MVRRTPATSQSRGAGPAAVDTGSETSPARPARRLAVRLAIRLALIAALALGALTILHGLGWSRYLSLHELGLRRRALQAFVGAHRLLAMEIYAGAYAILVALSLPGALLMSLAGGYFFGLFEGAAAAVAGMTVGAVAMYLVARTALGDLVARAFSNSQMGGPSGGAVGDLAQRVRDAVASHGFFAFLTLRLIPGVPFALVNILAGVVGLPFGRYLVATVLGVTPSTLIYCWIGQDLGRVLRPGGHDLRALIRPEITAPAALLGLLIAASLTLALRRKRPAQKRVGRT